MRERVGVGVTIIDSSSPFRGRTGRARTARIVSTMTTDGSSAGLFGNHMEPSLLLYRTLKEVCS